MRVGAAVRWRREPPARAPAASVRTWVADRMLRRTIERHSRCSVASCRHLSSQPGPLESRRRLGKRHMSGIMPSHDPYRLSWYFEVLSDQRTWQWEPPTSSAHRSAKKKRLSFSSQFDRLIAWLEDSDASEPFLQPPADADAAVVPAEEIAQEDPSISTTQEAVQVRQLNHEVLELRSAISSGHVEDEQTLLELCRSCKASLRSRIMKGELSAQELAFAMNPLNEAARMQISIWGAADRGADIIHRGVLGAIARAQSCKPDVVTKELWMTLVQEVCAMNGSRRALHLFWTLLKVLPSSLQIPSEGILAVARSFTLRRAARRHMTTRYWIHACMLFNKTVALLSDEQRQTLRADMAAFISKGGGIQGAGHRLRVPWLVAGALSPQLARRDFVEAYVEEVRHGITFKPIHVWQLMAARLFALGHLRRRDYRGLLGNKKDGTLPWVTERWASLILALMRSPKRDKGLQELSSNLHEMGALQSFARVKALRGLITAYNDGGAATRTHKAVRPKDFDFAMRMVSDWALWKPHVERLVKDPETEQQVFWCLNLMKKSGAATHGKAAAAEDLKAKMAVLDEMSGWFMETDHLRHRQALRRLEKCADFQRRLGHGMSLQVLVHLVALVTADLEKGGPARPSRMLWLTKLIATIQGRGDAERSLTKMKGWRWKNQQLLRGRR